MSQFASKADYEAAGIDRKQIEDARLHFHEQWPDALEDMDALCDLAIKGLAASDLLAALERVIPEIAVLGIPGHLEQARAAIAKATGK